MLFKILENEKFAVTVLKIFVKSAVTSAATNFGKRSVDLIFGKLEEKYGTKKEKEPVKKED